MKYISILRGINVAGHKKIKMLDLIQLFEKIGCMRVRTYIQSGNVIFDSEISDKKILIAMIEKEISLQYGFDVPVIIRTHQNFKKIISNCPFAEVDLAKDGTKVLLTMLSGNASAENIKALMEYVKPPEQLVVKDTNVYLHCPNGYGNSNLSNVFIEKKLKRQATTRNWKSIHKLFEMSQ